jgi:TatD DNase family protein
MRLIDTHAHLTDERFTDDLEAVLARAREAGVEAIVVIGASVTEAEEAIALAHRNHGIWATVGLHPHEAKDWGEEVEARLRGLAGDHRVVAVGETGLDHHYDFSPRDSQTAAFRAQMLLAKELDLPVVIHCREAGDDVLSLLEEEQSGRLRGVVHCFGEDLTAARRVLEVGFYLGIGGLVTFKNAEPLRAVIREIGIDRVVLETDAPHMAPVPRRGKRNEPALIRHTASKLAEVTGLTVEEVAAITTRNAENLYQLPRTQAKSHS